MVTLHPAKHINSQGKLYLLRHTHLHSLANLLRHTLLHLLVNLLSTFILVTSLTPLFPLAANVGSLHSLPHLFVYLFTLLVLSYQQVFHVSYLLCISLYRYFTRELTSSYTSNLTHLFTKYFIKLRVRPEHLWDKR